MHCSLMRFAKNKYSQNGEDGVLEEIFFRLGINNGWFVEFGAGNGIDLSNTLKLAEEGWRGVWIEADKNSYGKASVVASKFNCVIPVCSMVGFTSEDGLDHILSNLPYEIPTGFDFVSIDIDSYDLEVWKAIEKYRSKVVMIEINSSVPIGVYQTHGNGKEGASFTSMVELAKAKGYKLVCHTGNLIFVDEKLFDLLQLPKHEQDNPNYIFDDKWVRGAV